MRRLMATVLLAASVLAHGFWRAGSKLHHVFGGTLMALWTLVILPLFLVGRIARRLGLQPNGKIR